MPTNRFVDEQIFHRQQRADASGTVHGNCSRRRWSRCVDERQIRKRPHRLRGHVHVPEAHERRASCHRIDIVVSLHQQACAGLCSIALRHCFGATGIGRQTARSALSALSCSNVDTHHGDRATAADMQQLLRCAAVDGGSHGTAALQPQRGGCSWRGAQAKRLVCCIGAREENRAGALERGSFGERGGRQQWADVHVASRAGRRRAAGRAVPTAARRQHGCRWQGARR